MFYKRLFPVVLFLAVFLFTLVGCSNNHNGTNSNPEKTTVQNDQSATSQSSTNQLKVHFLDVGQADSIFVQMANGQNMLVDAGNNDDGSTVVNYLRQAGVKQIDYLVGTHPHEDHIGGLDSVIQNFNIGKIYMPKVTTTTKTFEDVLIAIKAKGLKITTAKAGVEIVNNDNLAAVLLAPNSDKYEDLNDYSAVIKITYNKVSFLLTGDAQEKSEVEMLSNSVISPKADVLKVGHHGSHSSTSPRFFKVVNPKYAVISLGAGNDYGHPHKETLQNLSKVNVYRTDLNGNVIFTTDGQDIQVSTSKNAAQVPAVSGNTTPPAISKTYVAAGGHGLIKGNINSKNEKIYHLPGGAFYDKTNPEAWFKTESEAQAAGYRPSKG